MEPGTFDYSQLPVDLRLHFLGLPAARRRGRPKDLTFLERVRVAQAHAEALNAHAVHVRDRGRERAIAKLQAKFRELCKAKAAPHKLAEVSAAIDKIGRVTRVAIKPPDKLLPEIDKQVAKLFGITERMVRKCRTDLRLRPFVPHPVWLERDWVKTARQDFEARQVAKRLMTPERFAKQEPVRIHNGGLQVAQAAVHEETYQTAHRMFVLQQWLNPLIPLEYRSPSRWLAIRPQWLRMEAQCGGWFIDPKSGQQVYFWEPHPNGRRIRRITYDTGMPTRDSA
jgi:hypothetical protein